MDLVRIATRGSPLALMQAGMVEQALRAAHPGLRTAIVTIKTSGDWAPAQGEVLLAEDAGGKAQFAREIEEALLAGRADIGVHSAKDMDSSLPAGLVMDIFLPREDVRDVLFISEAARDDGQLWGLAQGAVLGTSSPRRAAFLLHKRPDLRTTPLRGNVQTRLDKLAAGQVGATVLAAAGLNRLGVKHQGLLLEPEDLLPAAGQGAVGIEYRAEQEAVRSILQPIHHQKTGLCLAAERALVKALNGTCRSPIGALAVFKGGDMYLRGALADETGRDIVFSEKSAPVFNPANAEGLARALAKDLQA